MPGVPRAVIISWSFALQLACPLWAGPGDDDRLFAQIEAFVERERVGSRIPGIAVAIVNDARVVHARGYGEDGNDHPVTPATPFWIGSNTKSFTALAIMQLVEAGQVELDAPVVRYLPDFRLADSDSSARVTVRHLLNQTSGFSRQAGLQPLLEQRDETLEEAVRSLQRMPLSRQPGESFEYSNLNSVVLGRIVERVSGLPWQDYVQKRVLSPLEMTATFTSFQEAQRNGMSAVHRYLFGFPFKARATYLRGMAPSGYLVSSASDMARYLSEKVQPSKTRREPMPISLTHWAWTKSRSWRCLTGDPPRCTSLRCFRNVSRH